MSESRQVRRARERRQRKHMQSAAKLLNSGKKPERAPTVSNRLYGRGYRPPWGHRRSGIMKFIDGKPRELHYTRGWK